MMKIKAHWGDPCIYCGSPHDEVEIGDCPSAPIMDYEPDTQLSAEFLARHARRVEQAAAHRAVHGDPVDQIAEMWQPEQIRVGCYGNTALFVLSLMVMPIMVVCLAPVLLPVLVVKEFYKRIAK